MAELRRPPAWGHILIVTCALTAEAAGARAEPISDRLLLGVRVAERNACTIVKIEFNGRAQYLSHVPVASGDELRIQLAPLDEVAGNQPANVGPEAIRAPSNPRAAIHAIEIERTGSRATLVINFTRIVTYKVAQGVDFKSLLVAIAQPGSTAPCVPAQDAFPANEASSQSWKTVVATDQAGPLSDVQANTTLTEARLALDKGNPDRAVQLLTKLVEAGPAAVRQDALEMLGDARSRRGQLAHARTEYQDYLRQYPSGAGGTRVRAKLAALEGGIPAVGGGSDVVLGAQASGQNIKLGDGTSAPGGRTVVTPAGQGLQPEPQKSASEWTVSQFGSLSTFYNLNQGGRSFVEAPRINPGWERDDPYRTYQSAFLTSADYDARFERGSYAGRIRLSGTEQNNLIASPRSEARISSVMWENRFRDVGLTTRSGRITSSSYGVLGRFDGAIANYQITEVVKVGATAGSPLERSADRPFANDKRFFGVGAEASFFGRTLETSGYFYDQFTGGMVDRQSVGGDARFVQDGLSVLAAVDYDIHFGQLNSAILTGNKMMADQSTLSLNVDYRRAPTLLLTNAMQGQGVFTLAELLLRYTRNEIDHLALDRTAQSYTATASYSKPLTPDLQWNTDLTVNRLGGMPASGGLDAVPAAGTTYYASTSLYAMNFFYDHVTANGAFRYADTPTSSRYMSDVGISYPINPDLRINPILRFGYGIYKTDTRREYQIMPSVRTTYSVRPDTHLEFEVGSKTTWVNGNDSRELQKDLLVLAGVRFDFSSVK
jgi:hypothetical protein